MAPQAPELEVAKDYFEETKQEVKPLPFEDAKPAEANISRFKWGKR